MVLLSILKIGTDSAERRQRRLDAIKPPGPIVEAQKTEATTQPSDAALKNANGQPVPNAETRAAMQEIEDGDCEVTDRHP